MGEDDDGREHFSLKAILDQEKPKRKGKKKKDREEVRNVVVYKEVITA